MNSKMARTQNETPAWQSVVPGACGLAGLIVVVVFIVWLIRYVQPALFCRIGLSC